MPLVEPRRRRKRGEFDLVPRVLPSGATLPSFVVSRMLADKPFYVFCTGVDAIYSHVALETPSQTVLAALPNPAITIVSTPQMEVTEFAGGVKWYSIRAGTAWMVYGSGADFTIRTLAKPLPLGKFLL